METTRRKMLTWLRANGVRVALDLAVNLAGPVIVFDWAKPHWGDTAALLASTVPPLLRGLGTFAKERRIDALSVLALVGIGLSLLVFAGGGSVQLIALREKMITFLFGLAFLGSAAIGKPLIYPLARATMARQSKDAAADFESRRGTAFQRRTVMVMTWVWGFGLLADALLSILAVYSLPLSAYLIVSPLLGYATFGGLGLWTFLYRRHRMRQVRNGNGWTLPRLPLAR